MSGPVQNRAGSSRGTIHVVRELIATRSILWVLVKRDLKLRYAGSMLGWVWTVLEPLLMAGIYWFVFTQIFTRSVGQDPYIIFLLAGLLPWFWFTNGLTQGTEALLSQRRLLASTSLPRQIWVLRSVGAKGCEFLFSVPVFLIFLIFYRPTFDGELWLIPVGIALELVLLTGLGLLLSPIMVLVRDLKPIIRLVTRAMFYASPVIYSYHDIVAANLPDVLVILYSLNPVTGIMECYRAGFFPDQTQYAAILIAVGIAVVTLVVGWFSFMRLEPRVLKEI